MTNALTTSGTVATCHCGAVTLSLATRPREVTECNCPLCRRYGVLWAYCPANQVMVSPDPPTDA